MMKNLNTAVILLAFGLAGSLAADGRSLTLSAPLPMDNSLGEAYSPVSGGHAADALEATDASGAALYAFQEASVGMIASTKGGDLCVGSTITPPELQEGMEIDWERFVAELSTLSAYTNGYVFYTGVTNESERLVIARNGTFSILWPVVDSDAKVKVNYEAGVPQTVVPHRLFWTSAPFNGPGVSMSSNYGMKLFGDPSLFLDESDTNEYGVVNLTYGVYYEKENNICQAYAEELPDGSYRGPKGEFVVAYYDTGACERYLGCTVVEVTGPDAVYLTAYVGDELRPQNENYDPTSGQYQPLIQSVSSDTDDERAPYVYLQEEVSTSWHAKENRVYAISETLPGEAGAKKAEVYWEATDDFDVYWPFEQTCYHLLWPNCPTVVLGSGDEKGPQISIPSCYTPSLLDWREPKEVATVSGNALSLDCPGHFTLKLQNQDVDNFWLIPLNVAYPDDTTMFPPAASVKWPVGSELLPQAIQAGTSENGTNVLAQIDTDLPGYLHLPNSLGNNWNPELYHFDAEGATGDFKDLASAIYLVNVTTDTAYDAEVWWMSSFIKEDMPEAITYPILPQHYKAAWPSDQGAHEIVYSSQKGSGAGALVTAGTSLYMPSVDARGTLTFTSCSYLTGGTTVQFWINPSPEASEPYGTVRQAGDVMNITFGQLEFNCEITEPVVDGKAAVCRLETGRGTLAEFTLPDNRWTSVAIVATTNAVAVFAGGAKVGGMVLTDWVAPNAEETTLVVGSREEIPEGGIGTAAAGISVDGFKIWDKIATADELRAMTTNGTAAAESAAIVNISFVSAFATEDGQLYAQDAQSLRYLTGRGFTFLAPGRPQWTDGYLPTCDGIAPRVYVQNDSEAVGYNPNEEHAIAIEENGGYSVYALRSDMNDDDHPPYVLAEYNNNGRGAMRLYRATVTNNVYGWPTLLSTAGSAITIMHPYDVLPKGVSAASEVSAEDVTYDRIATYRDRLGKYWARRDGWFRHYIRYIGEPGFVCTAGRPDERGLEDMLLPAMKLENAYIWPEPEKTEAKTEPVLLKSAGPRLSMAGEASGETATSSNVKPTRDEFDGEFITNLGIGAIPQQSVWPDPASYPMMSIAQVLTKAEASLPDVYNMKTCAITYPYYGYLDDETGERTGKDLDLATNRVVKLIDPTVRKSKAVPVTSSFPDEYGFTLGSEGNLVNRKGYYYFQNLPPIISDRLFVDINSAGAGYADLVFIGDYNESDAGVSYLRVNSMSAGDCESVCEVFENLKEGQDSDVVANLELLQDAVREIYAEGDFQPSRQIGRYQYTITNDYGVAETYDVVSNEYHAADHYALVATGEGAGWVTIIENDGPGAESLPVSMHTFYVGTNLYQGKVVALTDENNVLSEQLSMLFTAPLGKSADDFYFQWYYGDEPDDGHVPTVPTVPTATPTDTAKGGDAAWNSSAAGQSADGAYYIDAVKNANSGSVSMKDLVNRFWTMHYRAKETSKAYAITGGSWSYWTSSMLAEGWIQRVLNAITPFSQRLTDLYENEAELDLSMPEQIGKPWVGDVALNNENLTEVGLVELYRTILNRAESMSIAQGAGTTPDDTNLAVNKQLLEATARLADMNMTLGAEAYSDAQNPLISSNDGTEYSGAVFCFANQVPSLLDEELALLRGRTKSVAPAMNEYPFYNRLIWNFTKGVTQGEVAYVNNYNIKAVDGVLDAEAAAKMYPQGHGDAYGYYLSTLKDYYRLLRNPNFTWGDPAMMSMTIADHVVNMDYQEEDKFAEAAYDLAKIGSEVVSLTARKQWKDGAEDHRSGYFDSTNTLLSTTTGDVVLPQAFGYGEWAARAGYGAFVNWAVANSLLPKDESSAVTYFKDNSISTITRETSSSLSPLGDCVAKIESSVMAVDAGLNPLGLSENTIPFDISPEDFEDGVSHYEQIRSRALTALDNAQTVLDYANVYGSRLRAIEEDEESLKEDADETEASYEKELIAIYGRPFTDDVGPGKTYEQGYEGPDLYHYMYMDLSEYGLSTIPSYTDAINIGVFDSDAMNNLLQGNAVSKNDKGKDDSGKCKEITLDDFNTLVKSGDALFTLNFSLTADGFVAMPTNWVGSRPCEGTLQASYRNFISTYISFKNIYDTYVEANNAVQTTIKSQSQTQDENWKIYEYSRDCYNTQEAYQYSMMSLNEISEILGYFADLSAKGVTFSNVSLGSTKVMGTSNSLPFSDAVRAIVAESSGKAWIALTAVQTTIDMTSKVLSTLNTIESLELSLANSDYTYYTRTASALNQVKSAWSSAQTAARNLQQAQADLQAAQQDFRTILEEGNQLLDERYRYRVRLANQATQARYRDMYARIARNNALSKFSTTFDVAQRYVFELAKVYDYETGLDVSDSASGKQFVNATIATRALGTETVVQDDSVTDGGLWDLVNRMDANFSQLKGRLGINNPDVSTKWFSLRYSYFRIDPSEKGDEAWRQELEKHYVDDILTDKRFTRYFEPPQRSVKALKEPGFIFTFPTSINFSENFFGHPIIGGETTYSSSDYAVKAYAVGLEFTGYDSLVEAGKLVQEPNVYLAPIGRDYMRAPLSSSRKTISFSVVDQILPLPYDVGEDDIADTDWVATFNGLDGTVDSAAKIRRHSTIRVDGTANSTRLVSRSVWNDEWMLVIPAGELNSSMDSAKSSFIGSASAAGVKDIKLGIQAYSRSGN